MPALNTIRQQIRANYLPDEDEAVKRLAVASGLSAEARKAISARAADLVRAVRGSADPRLMEVFLSAYGLSTKEGVALMCLAEALLRVPDAETMDDLRSGAARRQHCRRGALGYDRTQGDVSRGRDLCAADRAGAFSYSRAAREDGRARGKMRSLTRRKRRRRQ